MTPPLDVPLASPMIHNGWQRRREGPYPVSLHDPRDIIMRWPDACVDGRALALEELGSALEDATGDATAWSAPGAWPAVLNWIVDNHPRRAEEFLALYGLEEVPEEQPPRRGPPPPGEWILLGDRSLPELVVHCEHGFVGAGEGYVFTLFRLEGGPLRLARRAVRDGTWQICSPGSIPTWGR